MQNRKIAFRAWTEKSYGSIGDAWYAPANSMVKPEEVMDDLNKWINAEDKTIHLMQFTGLLDKNGKEIYEGDLVSGYAPDSEQDERFKVMVIEYYEDAFILARPNPLRLYFHDLSSCADNKSIEIIGNIYENKELLS